MKLIVGLGNPGLEYENTRHNIGFYMVDRYVSEYHLGSWKMKFHGLFLDTFLNGHRVIFLKPQSYMNLSGEVVRDFMHFYKIDIHDILIISDDLDLQVGNFKLREKGSCGGHNGLRDIEKRLGTQEYKRLKVGISNNKDIDTKDYVLGKFSKEDMKIYINLYSTIKHVLDDFFEYDFSALMSLYNRKNR